MVKEIRIIDANVHDFVSNLISAHEKEDEDMSDIKIQASENKHANVLI